MIPLSQSSTDSQLIPLWYRNPWSHPLFAILFVHFLQSEFLCGTDRQTFFLV